MSWEHTGGNAIPQITREEHDGGLNAKRTTLASSASIYVIVAPQDVSSATITAWGNLDSIQQAGSNHSVLTTDYAHHEIHEGDHYFLKGWQDVGANATISFLWRVPNNTKWPHARWNLAAEAEATFTMYENPTVAAAGSAVTVWNNNRNSTNTPGVTAFSTPSITALGTPIYAAKLGSGRSIGGADSVGNELVGKQNEDYLFVMANNDATATRWVAYDFYWYEHADKN